MKEKFIFTDELYGIEEYDKWLEYENKWIECKDDLSRKIIKQMILESKIFEIEITVSLDFEVQGVWISRLQGYLSDFRGNPTVKSNEVTICVTQMDDIDRLKKSIDRVKKEMITIQDSLLNATYVFDENESVAWNRNQVNAKNAVLSSDINLLNQMYYLLNQELMNLFVSKVKEQYKLSSVPDDVLSNMLHECIQFFDIKNADKLNWDIVERKMNSITKVFDTIK